MDLVLVFYYLSYGIQLKSIKEIDSILDAAEIELSNLCKKYNLTLSSMFDTIYLDHQDEYENGDLSIYGREVESKNRGYIE